MKFLKCIFSIFEKNFGALLISAAIIIASIIYANFNQYENCKRDLEVYGHDLTTIARICGGSGS